MGFVYNLPFVVLLTLGTAARLASRRAGRSEGFVRDLVEAAAPYLVPVFRFFAIEIDGARDRAAIVGSAAQAAGGLGLALNTAARIGLGDIPLWFAVDSLALSLAAGLATAKLAPLRGRFSLFHFRASSRRK